MTYREEYPEDMLSRRGKIEICGAMYRDPDVFPMLVVLADITTLWIESLPMEDKHVFYGLHPEFEPGVHPGVIVPLYEPILITHDDGALEVKFRKAD